MKIRSIAAAALTVVLACSPGHAKPGKGNGKDKEGKPRHEEKAKKGKPSSKGSPKGDVRGKKDAPAEKVRVAQFHPGDRNRVIRYFEGFKGHKHGLPPGLAKNLQRGKPLPPGWRDKLVAGFVLDDPWRSPLTPVPYAWFPDLPVAEDVGLYWYGDRVVRVYEPRREIVEVIVVPTIHVDL